MPYSTKDRGYDLRIVAKAVIECEQHLAAVLRSAPLEEVIWTDQLEVPPQEPDVFFEHLTVERVGAIARRNAVVEKNDRRPGRDEPRGRTAHPDPQQRRDNFTDQSGPSSFVVCAG